MPLINPATSEDRNPFRHQFKFRHLFLYFLSISFGLGIITSAFLPPEFDLSSSQPYLVIFNAAVTILLCLLLLGKMVGSKMDVGALMGKFPPIRSWWLLLMVLPVMTFSLGSGQIYFYLAARLFPEQTLNILNSPVELPTTDIPMWESVLSGFAIAAIAPFTEEFLFRGILLHRWSTKLGIVPAVILSSIFFGCLHPNPIGLAVFGFIISLIYLKTQSLWLAICFHSINNGIVVGLSLLSSRAAPLDSEEMLQQLDSEWKFGCFLVLAAIPFLLYFAISCWPKAGTKLPYFANGIRTYR